MKDYAFIVTKPLQLMVSLSIQQQLGVSNRSHIVLVDAFAGAQTVSDRLSELEGKISGFSTEFVQSIPQAYRVIRQGRYSNLFIDADVGIRKGFDLIAARIKNRNLNISVYEEGVGSYRSDIYSGIRKHIVEKLGFSTNFGGFKLTSNIYLYDTRRYREAFPFLKTNTVEIRDSLSLFLDKFDKEVSYIFSYRPIATGGDHCTLYLSSWTVDKSIIDRLGSYSGDFYVKLHPHILGVVELPDVKIIPADYPAEIVIKNLRKIYKKVNVYHHGSSVENYIRMECLDYIKI